MTVAHMNRVQSVGYGLKEGYAAFIRSYQEGAARRRAYRQTVWELQTLSDNDLSDLGIARCDIHRVALESVNGK
ncbi:DUF1127 domain-containing protein [Solirhodobacter olei]|uniref:DUF1127 domain-containing protein n=1 Tax=Solirhodobacter olei TaxID=2493082 RepID=UPI001F4DFB20|nr:DUF1127 domain-containing protein [Solirhodobacter olei]